MIKRLPDWEARLYAYLHSVRLRPYAPVEHNCAHFILGAIEALTGDDAAARLGLELPGTELGVARLLIERGGMRGIAEEYFGSQAQPILLARRGDIVVTDGEEGETLGVADGDGALCLTREGLWRFVLSECEGCWRLG